MVVQTRSLENGGRSENATPSENTVEFMRRFGKMVVVVYKLQLLSKIRLSL